MQPLGQEDPLEEKMATCSSTLAWEILQTEKPGGLWPTGSQRSGTHLSNQATVITYCAESNHGKSSIRELISGVE